MSVVHFQCPSCQAPLRVENRALFVGRTFDCPDCGESLLIEATGSTGVIAKRSNIPTRRASEGAATNKLTPAQTHRASLETTSKVSDRGVDLQSPQSAWDRLSRRPALLGWIVAVLCAALLFVVVNSGHQRGLPEADTPAVADNKTPATAPQESAEQNSKTAVEPDPVSLPATTEAAKPKDNFEQPPPDAPLDSPRDSTPPAAEKPAAAEAPPPVPVAPPPEPVPVSVTLSAEAIEAKLRQKIVRFDKPMPIAFVKLLDTVEELAGVPIVWDLDRVADEQLQKPVTIRLKETTVGEILDTLLKQVGLERRIVAGKIELLPRTEPDPRP